MEILGYSERGIINSLFYEMKFSHNNLPLLNDFLSLVLPEKVNFQISTAEILIEQSFYDFGIADSVLLVDNLGVKQAIFIEAKINRSWDIYNEYKKFKKGLATEEDKDPPRGFSSNLFVQLYFKTRLVNALKSDGKKALQEGLQFPKCLLKKDRKNKKRNMPRKVGNNFVVLKAVRKLKEYSESFLLVAMTPDNDPSLERFYNEKLKEEGPEGLQGWDIRNWGYLSLGKVKEFCKEHHLNETLRAFEWNEGTNL